MNRLHHLYISPLEQCNLCCKMCYTTKSAGKLTNDQILDFVHRYHQECSVQSITFCGGEVFILPDFPGLVNLLTQEGIFIQIITNGTIDRLKELDQPNLVNLIVSIDGLPQYHDQNRGKLHWQQSVTYIKTAIQQGFHAEIFSIVTKENRPHLDAFEAAIEKEVGQKLDVTYHPRKPMKYLESHPVSNQVGETSGFSFITPEDREKLAVTKTIFPPPNLGCYQISVMSDGQVYGCCEGIRPLGPISSDIKILIDTFTSRIDETVNCVEPEFLCGLK